MDKQTLEKMAVTAFGNLTDARAKLFTATEAAIEAKSNLETAKYQALTGGVIDGKNAEIREAQLRTHLDADYSKLSETEKAERRARLAFPVDKWFLSYLGFFLTSIAMNGYFYEFLFVAVGKTQKTVSLIMAIVCGVGALAQLKAELCKRDETPAKPQQERPQRTESAEQGKDKPNPTSGGN